VRYGKLKILSSSKLNTMEKSRDFQLFMTQNDEQQFCEELRGYNPNIFFLDISPSSEADISKRLYTSVVNSSSSFFSIVNLI
jgi:hypothetical protein